MIGAIPALGSANIVEILLTLFALGGLCVVGPNIWDAAKNIELLPEILEEDRAAARLLVQGRVRRELLRAVKLSLFVLAGVVSMATPGPTLPDRVTVATLFLTLIFFGVAGLIAGQSYLDRHESEQVRKLVNNTDPKEEP